MRGVSRSDPLSTIPKVLRERIVFAVHDEFTVDFTGIDYAKLEHEVARRLLDECFETFPQIRAYFESLILEEMLSVERELRTPG